MRPGIVLDDTPPAMSALSVEDVKNSDLTTGLSKGEEDDEPGSKVNCFAATLLGIKCKDEEVDGTADGPAGELTADNNVLDLVNANTINSDKETVSIDSPIVAISRVEEKEKVTGEDEDKITTLKNNLTPDRE